MVFTYSVATDRGQVRLLIFDTDTVTVANQLFQDDEIDAFLSMEGSVKTAAALALETIAVQEVLIQKVVRNMDLQTDGARVAEQLLKRAAVLREQDATNPDGDDFDWAEMVTDQFSYRQRIWNEALS